MIYTLYKYTIHYLNKENFMVTTLTLSCGTTQKTFNVNLKKQENLNRIFSNYNTKTNKPLEEIFNFSQNKCTIKDKSLFTKICEALTNLQKLAGDKNVLDDADFAKGMIAQPNGDKSWYCGSCEDLTEITYSTDKETNFFHITTSDK